MSFYGWRPYVSVAERRAKAKKKIDKLAKQGKKIEPVTNVSAKIANTFWGRAWCEHLEKFSDYENRLPRGRTYVRNGSVCHLSIKEGNIEALVSGSELYNIQISIKPLNAKTWEFVRTQCTGKIGSILELLQGKFSKQVMEIVTDRDKGLFPAPDEIEMSCSCPDWAGMCKHLAAVMYGIGARLDLRPELLFQLRGVDTKDLITADFNPVNIIEGTGKYHRLTADNLSALFGVEVDELLIAAPMPVELTEPKFNLLEHVPIVTNPTDEKIDFTTINGSTIFKLRNQFGMSVKEFAVLVGVIPATIIKWESSNDALNLRKGYVQTLREIAEMTLPQARKFLEAN